MFAFFGGAIIIALSVEPCASERSRHRYVPSWRASVRVVGIWHWFVKGCPTIGTMDAPPEEDTERIAKLREQRRADRERRRRAHQQAQAAASDERQAQADESQEEPVVARAVAAPI